MSDIDKLLKTEKTESPAGDSVPSADEILAELEPSGAEKSGGSEPVEVQPESSEPKRGRGRGRKSKEEREREKKERELAKQVDSLLLAGLAGAVSALTNLAASYMQDEKWKTDEAETMELAGAVKIYLDMRLPDVVNTPEGALLLALSGYFFKRL